MLLVLDQREWLCSVSEEADFGFSFSSNCWFRTECANCKKVAEPMSLSFRWQKIAKLHNRKSIWKRKIKNAMLTLWIWYCKEETEKSGIANVSLEWILRGGREGFFFFFGNKWVYRLVLSFSYGVTFLIKFYTWQIFKLGVFLHVAMALIAGKGLNPPIIGLLNQNSQKRNSTQGNFIPLNTSTFCITLIFFFFFGY